MFKIFYFNRNSADKRYPNNMSSGSKFFIYSWQSHSTKKFKKYNPEIGIEFWETDPRVDQIYKKGIDNKKFIVLTYKKFWKLGQYLIELLKYCKKHLAKKPKTIFDIGSIRHLLFYLVFVHLKHFLLSVQNYVGIMGKYFSLGITK